MIGNVVADTSWRRVGAADLDRQVLAGGGRHRRGHLVAVIPPLQIDRIAEGREVREGQGQAGQVAAITFARGRIDRDRLMFAAVEDRSYQSRQPGAWADFEEGSGLHPVHRLDLGNELDRLGKLTRQQFPGALGVVGIKRSRGIGKDRHRAGLQIHRGQAFPEPRLCAGHEPAVETPPTPQARSN